MRAGILLCYCIIIGLIATSCESTELAGTGEIYLDQNALKVTYTGNTQTDAMTSLGRVLFYDRQMSINNSVSCASCHKQEYAFSDNQVLSRGFEGRLTSRNSMPIQNLSIFGIGSFENQSTTPQPFNPFSNHLFWDGRETSLQNLILQPVGNHIEMGITDLEHLTTKLSSLPYYKPLFQDAFGSQEITGDKISTAVSLFLMNINSFNTKFDRRNRGVFMPMDDMLTTTSNTNTPIDTIFTPIETEGFLLFQDKYDCNACHQVQSPTGYIMVGSFANIGLDGDYSDPGLFQTTKNPTDIGKFRIPSLRNIAFTAPYMHDGRFESLEEVVDHYSEGIEDHPNLDIKLKDGSGHAKAMNISQHEKEAIIAFLHTLSDRSSLTDTRFSNPFKIK